jgi:hypothetical protein
MLPWFDVDKEGLAALLRRRGAASAVLELVQNAWDTNATEVSVTLTKEPGALARLVVTDDDPDGFADLTHAFTLFAPSTKGAAPTKRGRFNLGEKLVLALCDRAAIRTVSGAVVFDHDGRRDAPDLATDVGSVFDATIELSDEDVAEVGVLVRKLIVPTTLLFTYNGEAIEPRTPLDTCRVSLPTEVADSDGVLHPRDRTTDVGLYALLPGETAMIYELGIPVVEWDGPLHADVGQKIPLDFERSNVKPKFLRALQVAVLNAAYAAVSPDELARPWAASAIEDPRADDEAVRGVIDAKFGPDAVAFDPSDVQANKEAAAQGLRVVGGRALSTDGWAAARRVGALQPAGKVTPSRATVELSVAEAAAYTPPASIRDAVQAVCGYATAVARHLLGAEITVGLVNDSQADYAAAYGKAGRALTLNVGRLGKRWFTHPDQVAIDALLIHEFGHDLYDVPDHLDSRYHDALCELGARLRDCPVRLENFRAPAAA